MDAKRLEELAAKCEKAASGSRHFVGDILTAPDLHDLARCAAAWAKVERMLATDTDIELARCYGGEIRIRLNDVKSTEWGPTALEAVEAPEVKP